MFAKADKDGDGKLSILNCSKEKQKVWSGFDKNLEAKYYQICINKGPLIQVHQSLESKHYIFWFWRLGYWCSGHMGPMLWMFHQNMQKKEKTGRSLECPVPAEHFPTLENQINEGVWETINWYHFIDQTKIFWFAKTNLFIQSRTKHKHLREKFLRKTATKEFC